MAQNIALDFDGSAGTNVTVANSGASNVSGTIPTYTATAHDGTGACSFSTSAATSIVRVDVTPGALQWMGWYIRTGTIGTAITLATWFSGTTKVGGLTLTTGGKLTLQDASSGVFTTTTVLSANTYYRVAVKIQPGSATGHQLKLYAGANLDGATATEDSGGLTCTNAAQTLVDSFRTGVVVSATYAYIVDRLRGDTASEPPGVTAAAGTYPTKVWNGSAWVTKPAKVWNGSAWVVKVARNVAGVVTPPTTVLFGSSYGIPTANNLPGFQTMDASLASAAGLTGSVMRIRHTYSGSGMPTTFATSTAAPNPGIGVHSILATKADPASVAAGTFDAQITTLVQSCPANYNTYIGLDHEPEDNWTPAAYRAGVARFAKVVCATRGSLPVYPFFCTQAYNALPAGIASGRRYSDWDPFAEMAANSVAAGHTTYGALALSNVVMTFDGYTSNGAAATVASIFDPSITAATANGWSVFAISETAIQSLQPSDASSAGGWIDQLAAYAVAKSLVYVAWFVGAGTQPGPDGGFMYDATEKSKFANYCRSLGA